MTSPGAGQAGEDLARRHLESKGYAFLAANYRTRLGEVDLVMRHKGCVVFVEVKARRSGALVGPFEAVTRSKQSRVLKAALEFIKAEKLSGADFRFDVVSVTDGRVEHLENAFPAGAYTL